MKGNSKKVTLLDKNNPYSSVNEEWIELEDLSQLKRPNSKANDQRTTHSLRTILCQRRPHKLSITWQLSITYKAVCSKLKTK